MSRYYKYIIPIVAIKLSIFLLISCNADDFDQKNEPMQFNVDTSLISTSIYLEDSNILLRPPIGWDEISDIEFEQMSKSIQDSKNIFNIHLKKAFKSAEGALLIISRIQSKADNFGYIPPDYIELLTDQFNVEHIPFDVFEINQLPIRQYLINSPIVVIFKLFVSSASDYQIDYIIPKRIYENELKKIESSIGSINKQKENK